MERGTSCAASRRTPDRLRLRTWWNPRTEFVVKHLYTRMGFFTPPYDTKEQLEVRLKNLYREVTVEFVESLACFSCVK